MFSIALARRGGGFQKLNFGTLNPQDRGMARLTEARFQREINSWRALLAKSEPETALGIFQQATKTIAGLLARGLDRAAAADALINMASAYGVSQDQHEIERIITNAFERAPKPNGKANGHAQQTQQALAPLTIPEWLDRELPEPDWLLGRWFSTTSRVIAAAPTGLGKTMLGMRLGLAMAAGSGFLHWHGVRAANVLMIDGEMSRRLIKARLAQEVDRSGLRPPGMHLLNHEDVANFAPLNTREGQAIVEAVIQRIGTIDAIIFDNVMSLITGDMKDEESWNKAVPWIKSLTRRHIGQLWLHHTGHDETRGYGTKTREWQMDAVIHLEKVEHPETDVAFVLRFKKAREREPATRNDFADMNITLIREEWNSRPVGSDASDGKKLTGTARKFLEALCDTIGNSGDKINGRAAASLDAWKAYCTKRGLLDKDGGNSARASFSKYRMALITANKIACEDGMAWLVDQSFTAQRTMNF